MTMRASPPSLAPVLALCGLVGLLAAAAASADNKSSGKSSFRWVDDKGVVHYGDRIPPEYVRRERTVLNDQGVEVARLPAQRTAEQQAQDSLTSETQRKQSQHDGFLLSTYQSVHDIEQLRDTRLQQLGDQRHSIETYVDSLNARLGQLQERVQMFKPYSSAAGARPMPDQLAEDIVRTVNESHAQRNVLNAKLAEENTLRQQFQLDIDRYRQLKATVSQPR
jgi:hypothetical protein